MKKHEPKVGPVKVGSVQSLWGVISPLGGIVRAYAVKELAMTEAAERDSFHVAHVWVVEAYGTHRIVRVAAKKKKKRSVGVAKIRWTIEGGHEPPWVSVVKWEGTRGKTVESFVDREQAKEFIRQQSKLLRVAVAKKKGKVTR